MVERQDYKTLNTLLRRNQNVNMSDTTLLNEDNGKLTKIVKYTNQSNSNSQILYYEPKRRFVQTTPEFYSRFCARYY